MARALLNRLKSLVSRGRHHYRIQVLDEADFGFKRSFRLSFLKLVVLFSSIIIVMVLLTIYLVAFTGLREYIPGYSDPALKLKTLELEYKTDSLADALDSRDFMLINLQKVLKGEKLPDYLPSSQDSVSQELASYRRSPEDSLLRLEMESQDVFMPVGKAERPKSLPDALPFPPAKGWVTDSFDLRKSHYGVDVSTERNEAVKSMLDGTVIYADWSFESGYTLVVQHGFNLVTVYKHNAVMLKKQGAFVRAGEPIGIVGNSGDLSSGHHMHFEVWYEGLPVDPLSWVSF